MVYKGRAGIGHNGGTTRTIRVITVVLLVIWTCLMLDAQINYDAFIQYECNDYIMNLNRCFGLFVGYGVCFAPIVICWIADGFKQDKYL